MEGEVRFASRFRCYECYKSDRRGGRPSRDCTRTPGGMTTRERIAYLANIKAKGCVDCGTTAGRLDFDHRPGTDKRFNLSEAARRTKVYPDDEFLSEVAKCEVRCADCHTKATVRRWFDRNPFREAWGLVQPDPVRPPNRNMDRR